DVRGDHGGDVQVALGRGADAGQLVEVRHVEDDAARVADRFEEVAELRLPLADVGGAGQERAGPDAGDAPGPAGGRAGGGGRRGGWRTASRRSRSFVSPAPA